MNENAVSPEITLDDQADATEAPYEKPADAKVLGREAEFDPDGAERVGAFVEDALDEQAAAESSADLVEESEPVFLENVDPNLVEIPLFITKTHAREAFGVRPGESLDDALDRLARERQG